MQTINNKLTLEITKCIPYLSQNTHKQENNYSRYKLLYEYIINNHRFQTLLCVHMFDV